MKIKLLWSSGLLGWLKTASSTLIKSIIEAIDETTTVL